MQIFVGIFCFREAFLSKENLLFDKSRVLVYTFLISKSNNKNFCPQKWAFFWAYFLPKLWNNPSKSAPNKNFPFSTQTSLCNLNLVKFQLQSISQQKDIENVILLPISNGIYFLPRMLRTLSLYFVGLIQA